MEAFRSADEIVLVFPLYTDSMPRHRRGLHEPLAETDPALLAGKRVGYVVHSGFPESAQSEPLAAYLERMSARLGFTHLGTVIKGGSEGLRV
ncbi:MAG: NAD(P)H-dependent oxidoreductase [Candidatus Moduliflexus flocculans]|nr:NAD(P)H-dependent oxidoreductase [Candidatus Moduliflexus flocculans]